MSGKRIYFLRPVGRPGPIKIGCSSAPKLRLAHFAQWSPYPLDVMACVPGSHDDERFLHDCFLESHSHLEWFHATPELLASIAIIASVGSVDAVRGMLTEKGNLRLKSARAA